MTNSEPEVRPAPCRREPDSSSEFYRVERSAHRSLGREVLQVMSGGGIVEAAFYGEQYRERAEAMAGELNRGAKG